MARPIVITGGGTGGHIMPMVAIADAAEQRHWPQRYGARIAAVISNRPDAGGLALAQQRGIATAVVAV